MSDLYILNGKSSYDVTFMCRVVFVFSLCVFVPNVARVSRQCIFDSNAITMNAYFHWLSRAVKSAVDMPEGMLYSYAECTCL
jgi:hypothetical protein